MMHFDDALADALTHIEAGTASRRDFARADPGLGSLIRLADLIRSVARPVPDPRWLQASRARIEAAVGLQKPWSGRLPDWDSPNGYRQDFGNLMNEGERRFPW